MPASVKDKNAKDIYDGIAKQIIELTRTAEDFLTVQPEKCHQIQDVLQQIYKLTICNDTSCRAPELLPELVLENMDEEQIWQQLEIRNHIVLEQLLQGTAKLLALPEEKLEIKLNESDADDEAEESHSDESELENEESHKLPKGDQDVFENSNEDEEEGLFALGPKSNTHKSMKKKKVRPSIVDDKFFKLDEMEEFLNAEETKETRKQKGKPALHDEDGINYFTDDLGIEESEEDDNPNYKDFFEDEDNDNEDDFQAENEADDDSDGSNADDNDNKVEGKKVEEVEADEDETDENDDTDDESGEEDKNSTVGKPKINDIEPASDSESEDDKEDDKPKSSFELRQARLEQRIREYEEEMLSEKPWQLKGEILATNRPQNSLLEEILEFESTVRPPPLITEETTNRLEDIIKQRIKDQAWDDVELKVRPTRTPQEFRKQTVLDQEKSKESLAQIYEKEYQKELDRIDPNRDDNATEEEPKEHQEIRRIMQALFVKLDALSNFHFTPKPVMPEPRIITNTPAINMEEVTPVAVSDAKLLAPEEVFRGLKHELIGKTERTRTDKNRERRKKKEKQRAIHKALEARDIRRQKLGIPLTKKEENAKLLTKLTKHRNVEKMVVNNEQKSLKSSKTFFSKLQDTTSASNSLSKSTKRKPDAKALSAKRLKL